MQASFCILRYSQLALAIVGLNIATNEWLPLGDGACTASPRYIQGALNCCYLVKLIDPPRTQKIIFIELFFQLNFINVYMFCVDFSIPNDGI